MRKGKTHGTNSGPMALKGVHICCVIKTLSSASLPPRVSARYDAACHTFTRVGGTQVSARAATANLFIIKLRPLVDSAKQLIRVLSPILAGWFVPPCFAVCAQPRAPPAYHYQASGPYCITDGADRRERRQPACFLERRGVCS